NWDSTMVIAVSARVGGVERTIQSRFVPMAAKSPYKHLITCGLGLNVSMDNGSQPSLDLNGRVWQHVQTPSDSAWATNVRWSVGKPIDGSMPVTVSADAYVDAGMTDPRTNDGADGGSSPYSIRFNHGTTPQAYKRIPSPGPASDFFYDKYDYYCDKDLVIRVRNTTMWLLDGGGCFSHNVTVESDNGGPCVLIVVAKANLRDPGHENRGLWFQGGLAITDTSLVHVYLVSDGDIAIDQLASSGQAGLSLDARALTIVAGGD